MDRKHIYMTVEEKEEFEALKKQYGLREVPVRSRQEREPESQKDTEEGGRRRTRQ